MNKKILRKTTAYLVVVMMFFSLFTAIQPETLVQAASLPSGLKILEIQPCEGQYQLPDIFDGAAVTHMSVTEFNGKNMDVNGSYDIIYFGSKTKIIAKNVLFLDSTSGANYTKAKIDMDITNLRASKVMSSINSGQCVIFDSDTFTNVDTLFYENFKSFIHSNKANVVTTNSHTIQKFRDIYSVSNKRPKLNITTKPYDYSTSGYLSDKMTKFLFDLTSPSNNLMTVNLYLDYNGDGLFDSNAGSLEKVYTKSRLKTGDGYAINQPINEVYAGLLPWKLEVIDEKTLAKSYQLGNPAFKGNVLKLSVLQIIPEDSNLYLNSASPKNTLNLTSSQKFKVPLSKPGEYEITVATMKIGDFNKYPADVTDVLTKESIPTVLNGNYDMIIFGFTDSYSNKDLTESNMAAINALKDFITKTNQSVLFTHDTSGPEDGTSGGQNYNDAPIITKYFKTLMGFSNERTYAGLSAGGWTAMTTYKAQKLNSGIVTQFPYTLPDLLDIAGTHDQYWRLNLEDEEVIPWYTLNGYGKWNTPNTYFYTFSKGNVTYSGTGHQSPDGLLEQQLFINTILKASMAANHAPSVSIAENPTQVAKGTSQINFKYTVSDQDSYKDRYFNVDILIDTNGDGTYEKSGPSYKIADKKIENGKEQNETLAINILPSTTKFGVKVQVSDGFGALTSSVFSVDYLSVPMMVLNYNKPPGYLTGDVGMISYLLTAENSGNIITKYSDVKVTSNIKQDGIELLYPTVWAITSDATKAVADFGTADFKPTASWSAGTGTVNSNIKTINLQAKFTKETTTQYAIVNDISYLSSFDNKTHIDSSNYSIDVKSGKIYVEVKDKTGRVKKNIPVSLKRGGVTITSGVTDNTGLFTKVGLSSGSYEVTITGTGESFNEGYAQIVQLSYSNPLKLFSFNESSSIISNVAITDEKGKVNASIKSVNGKILKAKVKFKVNGSTNKIRIVLTNTNNYQMTAIGLSEKTRGPRANFTIEKVGTEYHLVMPNDALTSGEYTATFKLDQKVQRVGKMYKVTVKRFELRDNTVSYDSDNAFDVVATPAGVELNVKVVKLPRLY